jgi:hypothetical protein
MGEEAAHLIVRMGRLKKEEEEGVPLGPRLKKFCPSQLPPWAEDHESFNIGVFGHLIQP